MNHTSSPEHNGYISNSINDVAIINSSLTREASLIFRAVNNSFRQRIIELLNEKKSMSVTDLFEVLEVDQSVVSQHLSILRRAKIVNTKRIGKNIYYSVNYHRISKIHRISEQMIS
jgi:DNA-binding transcriptional ArsR family regulator